MPVKTSYQKARADSEKDTSSKKLYRSEKNKILAGVAVGLGEYFRIDPTLIRIIFVLMTVFGGSGIIIYLILWLIMPSESSTSFISEQTIRENMNDMKTRAQSVASDLRFGNKQNDSKFWWGGLILLVGLLFLFNNLGFFAYVDIGKLWPVLLIFLGISVLVRK